MLAVTPSSPSDRASAPASAISTCSRRCRACTTAGAPSRSAARPKPGDHLGDGPVADDVEAGLDARLGAGHDVLGDLVGVEVEVAGGLGVGVRRVQGRGAGADRAVHAEVAGGAGAAQLDGRVDARRARPSSRPPRAAAPAAVSAAAIAKSSGGQMCGRAELVHHADAVPRRRPGARAGSRPPAADGGSSRNSPSRASVVRVARDQPGRVVPLGVHDRRGRRRGRRWTTTAECTSTRAR